MVFFISEYLLLFLTIFILRYLTTFFQFQKKVGSKLHELLNLVPLKFDQSNVSEFCFFITKYQNIYVVFPHLGY